MRERERERERETHTHTHRNIESHYYKEARVLQETTNNDKTQINNNNNNNVMKIHMYQGNEKMKKTCPKASKCRQLTSCVESPPLPPSQELKAFWSFTKSGWRSKPIMHSYLVIRVKLAIHSCNRKHTHTHTHTQRAPAEFLELHQKLFAHPLTTKLSSKLSSTLCSTAHTVS
jgi:hypothetical protein